MVAKLDNIYLLTEFNEKLRRNVHVSCVLVWGKEASLYICFCTK